MSNRDRVRPYETRDGSEVWELLHPSASPVRDVSLAEAFVMGGEETKLHVHQTSQEIYYILAGEGIMTLASRRFDVREGDAILIPPGAEHSLRALASGIRLLCICTPPYGHDDTKLSHS